MGLAASSILNVSRKLPGWLVSIRRGCPGLKFVAIASTSPGDSMGTERYCQTVIGGHSAEFAAAMVDRNRCWLGDSLVQEGVARAVLLGIKTLLVRDEIVVGLRQHGAVLRVVQAEFGLRILQDPLGGSI